MKLTQKAQVAKKTEEARKVARERSVSVASDKVRALPSNVISPKSNTANAVIFGNCLYDGGEGYYYMWTSCNSDEACGEDCVWTIPYDCAVAGTIIGYCADNCPAWAVEISC